MNGAWRSSTPLCASVQYSAKNTGICTSSGQQPASGLKPSFLYSSIIALLRRSRSSPKRVACSSLMPGGLNLRILAVERYCASDSLKNSAFTVRVSRT